MIGIAVKRGGGNELAASRTATEADSGKVYTNASASNIYLTIDTGLSIGFYFYLVQHGTGTIGVTAGAGVTITGDDTVTAIQGQILTVWQTGIDTYQVSMGYVPINTPSTITPVITTSQDGIGDHVANPEKWTAPRYICMDSLLSADSASTDMWSETMSFWDFGDETGEFWGYGALDENGTGAGKWSKNKEISPVAGHVYRNPGTYTITLTVINSLGTVASVKKTVTITDPDVVFAGTNTIVISASGNFPAGLDPAWTQVTQSNFGTIVSAYVATGKRVLLCSGDTYTISSTANILDISNGQIGYCGSGAKPKIVRSGSATGCLNFWSQRGICDNWVVQGLDFDGAAASANSWSVTFNNESARNNWTQKHGRLLLLDCDGVMGGYNLMGYGNAVIDSSVYELTGTSGPVSIYGQFVQHCAYLGNRLDNNYTGEHVFRTNGFNRCIAAHNYLGRCNANKTIATPRGTNLTITGGWTANTAYVLGNLIRKTVDDGSLWLAVSMVSPYKTHATTEPTWASAPNIGDTIVDGNITWLHAYDGMMAAPYQIQSEYFVFNDNFVDSRGVGSGVANLVAFSETNDTPSTEELRRYCRCEFNFFTKCDNPDTSSKSAIFMSAKDSIVRFNVSDMTYPDASFGVTLVWADKGLRADGLIVENNSAYTSWLATASNHVANILLVSSAATTPAISVKGNLLYAPNVQNTSTIVKSSGGTAVITEANNSSNDQIRLSNPFVTAAPIVPADFKLSAGSYALAAGAEYPGCFVDFYRSAINRSSVRDIGAISNRS